MDGWDTSFLLGPGLFSGAFAVSFRQRIYLVGKNRVSISTCKDPLFPWFCNKHPEKYLWFLLSLTHERTSKPQILWMSRGWKIVAWKTGYVGMISDTLLIQKNCRFKELLMHQTKQTKWFLAAACSIYMALCLVSSCCYSEKLTSLKM